MLQASAYPAYLVAPSMQTPSLSLIQQLSQLPLLHTIRYTTNRSIHSIYRVHYLTDAKYSAEVRPNFGRSVPSAKTSASAEHCKGMFGAPLTHTYTHTHTYQGDESGGLTLNSRQCPGPVDWTQVCAKPSNHTCQITTSLQIWGEHACVT